MPDHLPPDALGVIVCGGQGTRLGGADKASLTYRGRTFLELAVAALDDCSIRVAVGEERPDPPGLVWTSETPAYGGPAAGLLAGIDAGLEAAVTLPTWVVALAVDMPLVTAETIRRLWEAKGTDGALLVDGDGRRQYLCAVYRISALLQNAPTEVSGMPVRQLLNGLGIAEVDATGVESRDIDVLADLEQLEGR